MTKGKKKKIKKNHIKKTKKKKKKETRGTERTCSWRALQGPALIHHYL